MRDYNRAKAGESASNNNLPAAEVDEEDDKPKKKSGFSGFSALDYGVDIGEELDGEEDFGGLMVRYAIVCICSKIFRNITYRLLSRPAVISLRRIRRRAKKPFWRKMKGPQQMDHF